MRWEEPIVRILGVDLGTKRVGMAISDPLGVTAQPLATIEVASQQEALRKIAETVAEHGVAEVVVGYPLNMDGTAGPKAKETEAFAVSLGQSTGKKVILWDERLTTKQALGAMRQGGLKPRNRRGLADRMAAQLLLQSYLDSRK